MKKLKALVLIMLPGLVFGAVLGIYPGYKAYEYTWKDAGFCISCHVHDYATVGWKKSIHGQLTTCHDCHHQPLRAYLKETYIMMVHRPTFPKDLHHTPYVPKNLCAACHLSNPEDMSTITGPLSKSDVEKLPKVDLSYLHKAHLSKTTDFTSLNSHELSEQERAESPEPIKELSRLKGEKRPIECSDCHGGPTNRGHNFGAVDVSCVRCHAQAHDSKVGTVHGCRTCHFQDFLVPVNEPHESSTKPSLKK